MELIKILQVTLTLFYGQLIAVAIYDNFLEGIPDLVQNPISFYNINTIVLGLLILVTSSISCVVIWIKAFRVIFFTGFLLILIFLFFTINTTINLALKYEKIDAVEKYKGILEIAFKSIVMLFGILFTFLMSFRGPYTLAPSEEKL
jgi:hypothetical protein